MTGAPMLVTGASGFIGGHLARTLRAAGARGVSRTRQDDPLVEWAEPFDARDPRSARLALRDVEVVVHAGGRAHVLRETTADSLSAFREANVVATRALVVAAREAGVRRFVLLSSVSVYGESAAGMLTASTPAAPSTPYGVSRLEAEQAAVQECGTMELAILRLPMVYGPGMKGNPLRLFDLVARGVPLPLGAIRNARSIAYVGNVVAGVGRLLRAPIRSGTVLLVADAEPVSTPRLVREIAPLLGRRARLVPVPLPLLRATVVLAERLLGGRFPLTPEALWRLSSSLVLDIRPYEALLGGPAPFSRAQGLGATAEWYLGHGSARRRRRAGH